MASDAWQEKRRTYRSRWLSAMELNPKAALKSYATVCLRNTLGYHRTTPSGYKVINPGARNTAELNQVLIGRGVILSMP
jgi:hypothetical protein